MLGASRFGIAAMFVLMAATAAVAQDVPIVGVWRSTAMGPPDTVTTVKYGPNGDMFSEMAIASLPGQNGGGGVIRTAGRYQLEGPQTIRVMIDQSEMCAAGVPCAPVPPQLGASPGSSASFNFSFRGSNQIIGQDGRVWLRIQ